MSSVDLPMHKVTLESFYVKQIYNLQDVIGGNVKYESLLKFFFPIMQKKTPTDEHASLGVVKLWLNEFTPHTCEVNEGPHFLKNYQSLLATKN